MNSWSNRTPIDSFFCHEDSETPPNKPNHINLYQSIPTNDCTYRIIHIGLCLSLLIFAKPNLIVNTDLLIILGNYFSLICKAEILYPPQFYLKRSILKQDPCLKQVMLFPFNLSSVTFTYQPLILKFPPHKP